jgi:hypothetical protein
MIFATRTGSLAGRSHTVQLLADVRPLTINPLDDAAAERLLNERRDLDRPARGVVKEAARANPLALRVLPAPAGLTCRGSMRRLVSAYRLITCGAWRS